MDKQAIFNTVWNHFIAEGNPPSISAEGRCRYRTEDGKKCAIGILIPDELYSEALEGSSAKGICDFADIRAALDVHDSTDINYLNQIQFAHDGAAADHRAEFAQYVKVKMQEIGKDFGLDIPTTTPE